RHLEKCVGEALRHDRRRTLRNSSEHREPRQNAESHRPQPGCPAGGAAQAPAGCEPDRGHNVSGYQSLSMTAAQYTNTHLGKDHNVSGSISASMNAAQSTNLNLG